MPDLPVPFSVQQSQRGGAFVMVVGGDLDRAVASELEELLRASGVRGARVVVDLRALEFIDSSGLAVLIRAAAEAQREGWELSIVASSSSTVQRIFTVSGMSDVLPFISEPEQTATAGTVAAAAARFSQRFHASPRAIAAARHAAAAHVAELAADADLVNRVALAVSEAATNAVLHAYVDAEQPGEFHLTIDRVDGPPADLLQITVADDGSGMMPRIDSPGVGMGLPIIAQVTDQYEVRTRVAGGTELCMRFSLSGSPEAG
jgi:serine/threonine-protein kinase RsbW